MGQNPSDADIRNLIRELDTDNNGRLEFSEFLKAVELQKKVEQKQDKESDLLGAFVAMGGNEDMTGVVDAQRLAKVIKEDFGLTIKIDELLHDLDTNNDGQVNYEEFKFLLG
jgi:calmodulin